MKNSEIQIGDWVAYDDPYGELKRPAKVDLISEDEIGFEGEEFARIFHEDWVIPIPITTEILEKNGFVLNDNARGIKPWTLSYPSAYISWVHGRLNLRIRYKEGKPMNALQIDCQHVHELQQALRICGIDKEITL